jgi:hypothetical protein
MNAAELASYAALCIGAVIALVYMIVLLKGLEQSKREMSLYGGSALGEVQVFDDALFDDQESGVLWRAGIGLVLSTVVLMLLLASPMFWYVVPFLSFGTAIAVVLAFLTDREKLVAGVTPIVAQPT